MMTGVGVGVGELIVVATVGVVNQSTKSSCAGCGGFCGKSCVRTGTGGGCNGLCGSVWPKKKSIKPKTLKYT